MLSPPDKQLVRQHSRGKSSLAFTGYQSPAVPCRQPGLVPSPCLNLDETPGAQGRFGNIVLPFKEKHQRADQQRWESEVSLRSQGQFVGLSSGGAMQLLTQELSQD